MKRSSALAPLSRDHHHALEAALRLRRAGPEDAAAAIAHFAAFFEGHGRRHFEIEEELILPALPADDAEWGPAVRRVADDHAAIRAQAGALAASDDPVAAARELGERLADHVRFEERVLFVLLEDRLDAGRLTRLGAAVADAEAT